MQRDDCPSDETLAAFNLGDLPEAQIDVVRVHQESCPLCEQRARLLESRTDPFLDTLRRTAHGRRAATAAATGPPPADDRESDVLQLADYEILQPPLGSGSMGVVYKARHLKLDRVVALKMIPGRSRQAAALFQIEARAAAQLQHPNIVQIFEIGRHEGQPFLVLEFVEGGDLEARMAGRPHPPRFAAALVRDLAVAVDHAHRHGIVHCDLKPSNILITPDGSPKIADFGVAKWMEAEGGWYDGDVVGTPRYMSPEQASGSVEAIGPAADVYSLGVILYELLTGSTPHRAPTSIKTLELVLDEEPTPLRRLDASLPIDLDVIVLKCLHKRPASRYSDARSLADDLGRFLDGLPVVGRKVGPVERVRLALRRRPAVVAMTAFVALWFASLGLYQRWYVSRLHRFESILRKVTRSDANRTFIDKPVLVSQAADASIHLRAFEAALSGTTLVLEPRFGNIGHWHSADDGAVWTFRVDRAGSYDVTLDYSNANGEVGNVYEVMIDDLTYRRKAEGTGSWSRFQSTSIGEASLAVGVHFLEVRSTGKPRGGLFDLRAVRLTLR